MQKYIFSKKDLQDMKKGRMLEERLTKIYLTLLAILGIASAFQ